MGCSIDEDAAAALTELVTLLDGLNRPRFASDPALLTAWKSARYLDGPDVLNPEPPAAPAPIPPIGNEATAPDSPMQERAA